MKTIDVFKKGELVTTIIVDDEDYYFLTQECKLYFSDRYIRVLVGRSKKLVRLGRLILERSGVSITNRLVDHIDRNPSNNVRSNLRLCSFRENSRNTSKKKNSLSTYKGVSRNHNKWCCKIRGDTDLSFNFEKEIDAAYAYDILAKDIFGEFACLNFCIISDEIKSRIKTIMNKSNRFKRTGCRSKYKGVSPYGDKWRCVVCVSGKTRRIGTYKTEIEAASAYNVAATQMIGPNAVLNNLCGS